MALQTAKGSFSAEQAAGNKSYTGIGFTPKVVLFWMTKQTATGYAAERTLCIGWAVSNTQFGCLANNSSDAVTVDTEIGQDIRDTFVLSSVNVSGGVLSRDMTADFVSMDAGGFTLHYSVAAAGTNYIVHYWALGGSDITGVWAGPINAPTVTGNQAYTGPGFQPDCLLLLTNTQGTIPRSDLGFKTCLGVTDGTSSAVAYVHEQNALPTNIRSLQKTGEVIHTYNFSGADNTVASLTSMDATGFTLNYSVVQATARGVLALALQGGQYWVGTDTQKTSTGTKAKTGAGFAPTGLLLFGTNRATSAALDDTLASLSIGASDGTNEGCAWVGSTDNVSTTDENSATVTDKILRHATNPSTTNAEADLSSLDADGYTLNWSTADATAREFVALAVGSASAGGATKNTMLLMGAG